MLKLRFKKHFFWNKAKLLKENQLLVLIVNNSVYHFKEGKVLISLPTYSYS